MSDPARPADPAEALALIRDLADEPCERYYAIDPDEQIPCSGDPPPWCAQCRARAVLAGAAAPAGDAEEHCGHECPVTEPASLCIRPPDHWGWHEDARGSQWPPERRPSRGWRCRDDL